MRELFRTVPMNAWHRDLKAEVTKPISSNMHAQQKCFDRWRQGIF